ncbi:MAG TPA: hypothetical protein VD948_13000 [Rhodothermales bacterium]|nr:hypothetical protein [Rhodothermales bacterium]
MATVLTLGRSALSLDAETGTGAGESFQVWSNSQPRSLPVSHRWLFTITGSPTNIRIDIEGSLDDSTWFDINCWNLVSDGTLYIPNPQVYYARANLVTLTGGSSPTVTARLFVG